MQRRPAHALQQQLRAVLAGTPLHGRGHRRAVPPPVRPSARAIARRHCRRCRGRLPPGPACALRRAGARWAKRQAGGAAFAEGLFGKGEVAVLGELDQQRVIGQVGLDQYPPGLLGASCAAGDLDDLLGHAFAGAEVGGKQAAIGIEDRHQGDPWEVVPLASIWVPTRMHGSPLLMVAKGRAWRACARCCRGRCAAPDGSGRESAGVPRRARCRRWRTQVELAALRAVHRRPLAVVAVVAAQLAAALVRVIRAQRGHWLIQPQSWQSRVGAKPRRLRNTRTCWPAARVSPMACCSGRKGRRRAACSSRRGG